MSSFESIGGQVDIEPTPSYEDKTFGFELYEDVVDPANPEGPKLIVMHMSPSSMTPVWELLGEGYGETTELLSGSATFVVKPADADEYTSAFLTSDNPTADGTRIGKGDLFCFLTDSEDAWVLSRPTKQWKPEYEARRTNSPEDELSQAILGRFATREHQPSLYEAIHIDDELELRALTSEDAARLYELTVANREYLSEFLPWADEDHTKSVDDSLAFIETTKAKRAKDQEYGFGIILNGAVVGHTSLMHLGDGKTPEIGYWIEKASSGRGITKKATQALTDFGFNELGLGEILIRARENNAASNRIAESLGYSFKGLIKDEDGLHNHWVKTREVMP